MSDAPVEPIDAPDVQGDLPDEFPSDLPNDLPVVVDAKKALQVKIGDETFAPEFVDNVYENDEILGYPDAKVLVEFDPKSMLTLVDFTAGPPEPDTRNPQDVILEFLDENTFTDRAAWEEARKAEKFTIPGKKVSGFDNYSIYKSTIAEAKSLLHRIRIFLLFYIDGASYIDEDEDGWELYFVVDDKTGNLVAFASVYLYFFYSTGSAFEKSSERRVRKRISQFLVFPPYRNKRIGSKLYLDLVSQFRRDPNVKQITVEDPNEAFDRMRDRCDLEWLNRIKQWKELDLPITESDWRVLVRKLKMVPRQARRCLEIEMLRRYSKQPAEYRRLVKQRLFEQNYEGLKTKDPGTQAELLRETYKNVTENYTKLLELLGHITKKRPVATTGEQGNDEPETKRPRLEDNKENSPSDTDVKTEPTAAN